jgi:hypothetical protein
LCLLRLLLLLARATNPPGRALTAMARTQQGRRPAGVGGLMPAFESNCSNFNFSRIRIE